MKSCSQCGYNMEPLDSECRKCKAQAVGAASAPAAQIYGQAQPPPAQNPWVQQAPPLNPTNQIGAYQRPDYAPPPPKRSLNFNMVYGGLACVFGIIATAWGFTHALHGGSYTIFWGAIVFGGLRFFRGMTGE